MGAQAAPLSAKGPLHCHEKGPEQGKARSQSSRLNPLNNSTFSIQSLATLQPFYFQVIHRQL